MTRKDYVKFAEMFKNRYEKAESEAERIAINKIKQDTESIFFFDNSRFDYTRFENAIFPS